MRKRRAYVACYWVGDDRGEVEFHSCHRAGSKANREDAMSEIRRKKGNYIANRAEIYFVGLQ